MADQTHERPHSGRGRLKNMHWSPHVVLFAAICLTASTLAVAQPNDGRCILIDSDAALDDFRAVAVLAPKHHIAAIVVTEGISRPVEGAGAIEALLSRGGPPIPVIAGASPNPDRGYKPPSALEVWRNNAERLNGTLPAPVTPSLPQPGDIAAALRRYTANCSKISLLVIGPWTSFLRYAAEILGRVDRIVAQGRPYQDEPSGQPAGFNCIYDQDSCFAAFDLLVGRQQRADRRLRVDWIDIPNSPEPCGSAEPGIDAQGRPLYAFRPTAAWSQDLAQAGAMARIVGEMLRANPTGWEETSLWDDLAALYLLRSNLFVARGGHFEPCVPAASIRSILFDLMADRN
jgi:hypothetical protein